MRRLAISGSLLGSLLALSGCAGLRVFLDDTHNPTAHMTRPIGNSETMREVQGARADLEPIAPASGNVWPGPVPPEPTLEDLETETPRPLPQMQGITPPSLSAVPPLALPGFVHHDQPRPLDPNVLTGPLVLPGQPGARTPNLPAVGTFEGGAGRSLGDATARKTDEDLNRNITPGQPQAVIVPNGDGTSTVIAPNGTISTIKTPPAKTPAKTPPANTTPP